MARGRMINQSIATDKRLNSLSLEAQLVYLMTIPHLDRDGLVLGEPYMLASQVCPRRPDLAQSMEGIIDEWVTLELVIRYDGKEDPILFFVGFSKNQGGLRYDRESPSQFPPPPGYKRTSAGLDIDENYTPPHESGKTPAEVRQDSGSSPTEGNRKEEKRKAGGGLPPAPQHRTRTDFAAHQSARHMNRQYDGVDPKVLTRLTDHVKRIYGFSVLIDKPGDDTTEDKMRGEAYRLWQLGYNSDEDMIDLRDAWNDHAARLPDKRPYKDQLYEVAIGAISRVPTTSSSTDFSVEEIIP